jgi:sigma-B regulation protein RsbU (phosphoserine phosphatase)
MLTADTDLMNKVAGLEYGADDYLHKPFNSIELMTRISSLLKNYEYQQIISRRNEEIERELEVARLLQQKLLPSSMPEVPGYYAHAIYIPMDKIGGDFYSIESRDGFLDIFIADVAGHGLPGAFLATITKIALENITNRAEANNILCDLNNVILHHTVQSNFVSAFFSIIDIKTKVMRYSSAGHNPPILYRRKNNEFIELTAKGRLLGLFSEITLEEKTIQLEPGDRIVFYTDGITECNNSSTGMYEEKRFMELIQKHSADSPENFSQALIKDLEIYNNGKCFEDDITMVVLDIL